MTSSRLISSATTKKKIAIRPSLTQSWRLAVIGPSVRSRPQNAAYPPASPRFAQANAATAAPSSTTPPTVSLRRKSTSGESAFRCLV